MMLMRWDVSLDLKTSKDKAQFYVFRDGVPQFWDHERQRSGCRLTLTGLWSFCL